MNPRTTILPHQEGSLEPSAALMQVTVTGCNLSHGTTAQIPPAATHQGGGTLPWAAKRSLCCYS